MSIKGLYKSGLFENVSCDYEPTYQVIITNVYQLKSDKSIRIEYEYLNKEDIDEETYLNECEEDGVVPYTFIYPYGSQERELRALRRSLQLTDYSKRVPEGNTLSNNLAIEAIRVLQSLEGKAIVTLSFGYDQKIDKIVKIEKLIESDLTHSN